MSTRSNAIPKEKRASGSATVDKRAHLDEIYWELLRRTPEYRDFYKKHGKQVSLTAEQQRFLSGTVETLGDLSWFMTPAEITVRKQRFLSLYSNPLRDADPGIVAGLMATQKFGVTFYREREYSVAVNYVERDGLSIPLGRLGDPLDGAEFSPIVSPDTPYDKAPCLITFLYPPGVELVDFSGISPKRIDTREGEALFRVKLQRPVDELVREFEKMVRKAKKALKKEKGLEKPSLGSFHVPILRKLGIDTFRKYLYWYDLHTEHKFSWRTIAFFSGRTKQDISPDKLKKLRIGKPVKEEDSVEKAVKLIYEIVHRKPYKEKVENIVEYSCCIHLEGDCPASCPTLKKWLAMVNNYLPT